MTRTKLTPHRTTGLAAALLAAALAKPDPAVGQSWAALVSAETACRAEPSPAADAVGMLEIGNVILVNRSVSALAGLWMHVVPGRSGGYVIPGGCWVPSANLARTTETEHFLQLADRLLSADVRPALDELLAVHNLFGRSWNRDRVEASAALTERRKALLARAVEVAQGPQWGGLRPADDPLVLAWLESLGEQVRYSEGRSGRGRWTVVMGAPEGEEEPSRSRQVESAAAPEGRGMAVIAPDVACRTRPSRTAWSWTTLPVDLHFRTERADTSVAGDAWVFVREQGCWVLAAHTATGGTDEHVLAIADRFLTSGEAWSFENHLRVHNVLSSRNRGHREDVEASAILGLRRLKVLRGALRPLRPGDADALTRAWIGSLGDEVKLAHEGHIWTVSDEAYLNLYEKHRPHPFAEEILWEYAGESVRRDCEGGFACSVKESVIKRLARYWIDFPNGRHIVEAVELGRTELGYGLEYCKAARGPEPGSREGRMWGWSGWDRSGEEITRELLATLEGVSEEDKAPLLEMLGGLNRCAGDGG